MIVALRKSSRSVAVLGVLLALIAGLAALTHHVHAVGTSNGRVDSLKPDRPMILEIGAQVVPTYAHVSAGTLHDGNLESSDWTFVHLADGGRAIVAVVRVGGSCAHLLGFNVVETASSVRLAAITHVDPGGNCTAPIDEVAGKVELVRPLGDRTLIHASA